MEHSLDTLHKIFTDTSTLNHINFKLIELKKSITMSNPTFTVWLPLLSSIIGGLLVWLGQFFERKYRRKSDDKKSKLEIYAYCRKLEAAMRNNYRELAMAKVHTEYWWYCYNTSSGEVAKKAYEEHLRSQAFAREIERRIGETKADFIGHVRKFQAIKKLPVDTEQKLNVISDLTHSKAKTYDTSENHTKVRYEMAENDETELRNSYYNNLSNFKLINDNLQKLL
jgi:hypothetical protein